MLIIIVVIFLIVLPLIGLIFFVRSLISKKNIGCGIAAVIPSTFILIIWISIDYSTSHMPDREVIEIYEWHSGLTFPRSGKILEKNYQEFFNFLGDYHIAFMIEVDTLSYNHFLCEIQKRDENIERRKLIELKAAEIFDFDMDTLDYKKIVKDFQLHYILDTLVVRKILKESDIRYYKERDPHYPLRFLDEEGSSSLLKKQFPAEDCAYAYGTWWFHKNKKIIVYEFIDY